MIEFQPDAAVLGHSAHEVLAPLEQQPHNAAAAGWTALGQKLQGFTMPSPKLRGQLLGTLIRDYMPPQHRKIISQQPSGGFSADPTRDQLVKLIRDLP